MTVREAQERINSREYSEWLAFDRIDPIGMDRGDLMAATIAATVANAGGGKKGGGTFTASDFIPDYTGEKARQPRQSVEEMMARLHSAIKVAETKQKG
jgi:hypothetical protein